MEEIDAIAATPDVDVIFVGTSDLSFSLGCRGQQNHPKLEAALEKIVTAGKANHKFLGLPTADPAQIKKRFAQGFQFFQTATELGLMARGARQLLEPLGKVVVEPASKALY